VVIVVGGLVLVERRYRVPAPWVSAYAHGSAVEAPLGIAAAVIDTDERVDRGQRGLLGQIGPE